MRPVHRAPLLGAGIHARVAGVHHWHPYDLAPRAVQQEAFRGFIALARRRGLPLVVHLRDAYADAVRILREECAAEVGGVIHCFSGDRAAARGTPVAEVAAQSTATARRRFRLQA